MSYFNYQSKKIYYKETGSGKPDVYKRQDLDGQTSGETVDGLEIAFNAISLKKDCYIDAIKYYIEKDTPNNLHPNPLTGILFSLVSDSEVYQIISTGEYSQKNAWLYACLLYTSICRNSS